MKKKIIIISVIAVLAVAAAVGGVLIKRNKAKTVEGSAEGCPYKYTLKSDKDTLTVCFIGDFAAETWSAQYSADSYTVVSKTDEVSKAEFEVKPCFDGLSSITFKKGLGETLVITTSSGDNSIEVIGEEYAHDTEIERATDIIDSMLGDGNITLDSSFFEELNKRMNGD